MLNSPKKLRTLIGALTLAAMALPAVAAEPAWVTKSNDNAKLLLNVIAKYSPEGASSLGVDGFDEQITDMSRDQFDATNRDLRAAIAEMDKRLKAESDPKIRQDLEILISSVVKQTLDPRISKERQKTLLVRLEKYAGLTKGYRPVTELANERLQERLKANKNLLGPYKGEVEQSLNSAPALIKGIKDLLSKSELKGWERSYAALETQLNAYNAQMKAQILPRARSDHRLPPEVYADNLRQYGVDISPQELMAKALTSFAEIRNQMNITAGLLARERKLPDADYRAVLRELKKQQIPTDKVMTVYAERLAQIEGAAREHRIVSLPARKAVIRLASAAENAQQPAPHMNPPRLIGNTGEYGEFVLTTGMTPDATGKALVFDDFTHQAGAWTLTAHEARPGHELQFAKMIEMGVSTARAVFAFNSVNVEGWALYARRARLPRISMATSV